MLRVRRIHDDSTPSNRAAIAEVQQILAEQFPGVTENGRLIGQLRLPTLVVQEGGYRTRTIGINARHFFWGLLQGARRAGG